MKAINVDEFSVGNLDEQYQAEMAAEYSLADRTRNPWNQYGVFVVAIVLVGCLVLKTREKFAIEEQAG